MQVTQAIHHFSAPTRAQGTAITAYPSSPDVVQWSSENSTKDTLPKMFRNSVASSPDSKYLGKKVNDKYEFVTYRQAQTQIHDFASGLINLGVQPGDRMALMSQNRPEWVIADMGAMHTGAICAPLYFKDANEVIAFQLKDTGASVVVVDSDDTLKKVVAAEAELPNLKHIICMEPTQLTSTKNLVQWSDLVTQGHNDIAKNQPEIEARVAAQKGTDVASMVYTSGSTGVGKGVMLSHVNWTSSVEGVSQLATEAGALKPSDVELSFLPLSHIFERAVYYSVTAANAGIAYATSPKSVKGDMKLASPSIVPCVPLVLDTIADGIKAEGAKQTGLKKKIFDWSLQVGTKSFENQIAGRPNGWWQGLKQTIADKLVFNKIQDKMGGQMKLFISGGAPLSEETAKFLGAVGVPVSEGYGASETLVLTANPPNAPRAGSVGKPLKGVQLRLSEEGEIQARGPMIMNGYLGLDEKTKENFTPDGWYKTGDIGKVDTDGYWYIVGRMKDQDVLLSGKKVQTGPIEQLLKTNDYIDQAVLCGHKRAVEGAVIAPRWEALEKWAASQGIDTKDRAALVADERVNKHFKAEVKKTCKDLSDYEQVKVVVISPESFTETNGMTTTGGLKIKRPAVLKHFEAQIEAAYNRGKSA